MLKYRIITAAILAPLVICAVYFLPTFVVAFLLGLVITIGAWEWAALCGLDTAQEKASYAVLIGLILAFCYPLIESSGVLTLFLLLTCVFWLLAFAIIVHAQMNGQLPDQNTRLFLLAGVAVLVPAWMSLIYLHGSPELGPKWVLFLLVIIWSADVGAYIAGRAWGKHKLADHISPGKSWQGVIGGLVAVVVAALVFLPSLLTYEGIIPPSMIVLCLITVFVSIVGDLYESVIKRIAGVKDSGTILPGHGGVMDRIDSLTAAAPIFTTGLLLSGVIR